MDQGFESSLRIKFINVIEVKFMNTDIVECW